MAYIEKPYENKDGSLTYRVRWRKGGGAAGKREGEKFHDPIAAKDFCDAVTRAGDEWPWGYVPGIGWDHEAYAALLKAQSDAPPPPEREAVTLEEFAKTWVMGRTKASETTRSRYGDKIRLHITPYFGAADISDEKAISEDTVNAWIIELLNGKGDKPAMARSSVFFLHSMLKSILKSAVRRKLRETNPCEETEVPRRSIGAMRDEMVFLTREQFHVLSSYLREDVVNMVSVAVNTGLRWGELSALQVRDVKGLPGPKPFLRISRAWAKLADGSFELGDPKTDESRRNVSLNPSTALILLEQMSGKKPNDFLFTSPSGKPWRYISFYKDRLRPAVFKAIRCEACRVAEGAPKDTRKIRNSLLVPCGCPGTLEVVPRGIHWTRHTHASWVIADGGQLTVLQRRLGHTTITMTSDRYGHLLPEVDDALVAALEAGWQRTLPAPEQQKALAA